LEAQVVVVVLDRIVSISMKYLLDLEDDPRPVEERTVASAELLVVVLLSLSSV
jgi:hypothetical protein